WCPPPCARASPVVEGRRGWGRRAVLRRRAQAPCSGDVLSRRAQATPSDPPAVRSVGGPTRSETVGADAGGAGAGNLGGTAARGPRRASSLRASTDDLRHTTSRGARTKASGSISERLKPNTRRFSGPTPRNGAAALVAK